MLLADARLPAGGYTQSGSLEPALAAGMRTDDVAAFLQARLATVTEQAAAAAVLVVRALRLEEPTSVIARTWMEWASRTPSAAVRANEETLGRGYQRLLERLWGGCRALRDAGKQVAGYFETEQPRPPRPIVLGAIGAAAKLSARQTARLVGYDDVQTVLSACLKLAPLDPLQASDWALGSFAAVEEMAERASQVMEPETMPALAAPQIDGWAQAHAVARERLFSA
jgi:urease accessory protein